MNYFPFFYFDFHCDDLYDELANQPKDDLFEKTDEKGHVGSDSRFRMNKTCSGLASC